MKALYLYDNQAIKFKGNDGASLALTLEYDACPDNPRDDYGLELTRFICWHNRYDLGDPHSYEDTEDLLRSLLDECGVDHEDIGAPELLDALRDHAVIVPLWLLDHSGLSFAAGSSNPFRCPWDSGQIGWAVVLRKDMETQGIHSMDWRRIAREWIDGDAATYGMWLSGDVYGFDLFELKGNEWERVDFMCGFYGYDLLSNGVLDYVPELAKAIDAGDYDIVSKHTRVCSSVCFD